MEKWFPNGVNTRYSYNQDNTLQQVVNRHGTGTTVSQHTYTYDAVGNRTAHTETIGGTTTPYNYTYDPLDRLTEVRNGTTPIESYTYDPLGNRKTKTSGTNTVAYVYDGANQLKELRQGSPTGSLLATLEYDNNGNLISKVEGSTTTTLLYDALNRMVQADKTGIASQSYTYDDQGRRIRKSAGGNVVNYLYNGPDIVAEYSASWALNALLTHGTNMDDPLIRYSGQSQYYHQDGLGSVVGLTNQNGGTDGAARYDAWGNRIAGTGAVPLYGYTGREPDDTGLIYYRARFYDPTIGRFIQRDPIGLQAGLNLYAYVGNNPINFTDPLGLTRVPEQTNADTQSLSYFNPSSTAGLNSGEQNLGGQVVTADWQNPGAINPPIQLVGGLMGPPGLSVPAIQERNQFFREQLSFLPNFVLDALFPLEPQAIKSQTEGQLFGLAAPLSGSGSRLVGRGLDEVLSASPRTFQRFLESLQGQAARSGATSRTFEETQRILNKAMELGYRAPRGVETEWVGGPHINLIGPSGQTTHFPVPPGFVP